MTSEEIKDSITMLDVLNMYGLKVNRKGFMCCPFHKEKTPSMKIYDKTFHCFGCNESGDVFTFVQKYQGCDFKEAFEILGGNYTHDPAERYKVERKKIEMAAKNELQSDSDEVRQILGQTMNLIDELIDNYEPFSDEWCDLQNIKPVLIYFWEYYIIDRNEVKPDDKQCIFEKCNKVCEYENRT